jgi:hypothetical protein
MNMINVATKDVSAIVRATFPSYRKRSVRVLASESVSLHGLNWSGGTRAEYRACSIDGQQSSRPDMSRDAPWENPFEGKVVPVPPGFCIVQGGFFCGKESILWIHINPSDMPKLLPKF